ncbi:MAG: tRNA (adenosine(37)-N6)-threonylcarbamoyltransferase complex transferase subunit TsaD [Clostridia bacterium]|nr:tRNA (adenosine(37)-N6)-threonylcarbamoyltransferase complex transferase subunit TsaD [Clostridia bacterium]MBQ8470262.1 tRNA (adenosine(37)-N6)-threonylcarbamoyltransferase complex transferase subunit TsaD [Clostridia bacterium]MBR1704610.1 tRNA (adenosine(37)-N6)-threonylcarbamoyltransferase complex transferase subunit TsaD [Clostridia bacterium]
MKILGIESSCDETAVSVVEDGRKVLSNVIASSLEEHILYGGVVPEIASRRHAECIEQVTKQALQEAGCTMADIDAIAVTAAPGLIGALLVGVNFAKGLSLSSGVPLVPVHHLRSHVAANYLTHPDLKPPFLALIASGGHSHIVEVNSPTEYRAVGQTRDDAAGECLDKTARVLGLPYPGGKNMDAVSRDGDPHAFQTPKPHVDGSDYDFSFSGLKTFIINRVHHMEQKGETPNVPDMGATIITAVVDSLADHTERAAKDLGYDKIVLAGGVSANSFLRKRFTEVCKTNHWELYMPELQYCGDNGAMVGAQGYYEYMAGHRAGLDLNAKATMAIDAEF